MLKQTIEFLDFNDEKRTETLYFNFTEAELVDIQAASEEGIQKEMEDAVKSKDMQKLLDFIKMLVQKSYGERDKDGLHFNKTPEITQRFVNSAMYSPLLLSLFQDEGARAEKFITGLMPADLVRRALQNVEGGGTQAQPVDANALANMPANIAPSAREQFEIRKAERVANEGVPVSLPAPEFATPSAPIQSAPSTQDAPPVDASPFTVKAEPMDADIADDLSRRKVREAQERAEFEAWKAQRNNEQA